MSHIQKPMQLKLLNLSSMTKASWIYISDPTVSGIYGRGLSAMIPEATSYYVQDTFRMRERKATIVVIDRKGDNDTQEKIKRVSILRSAATNRSTNLVSINIMNDLSKLPENSDFGISHLDIAASTQTVAQSYQWLCMAINRDCFLFHPWNRHCYQDCRKKNLYSYESSQYEFKYRWISKVDVEPDGEMTKSRKRNKWKVKAICNITETDEND